ncbi:MAG: hypothetical protein IPL35_06310 [Sphingobacteriales bacterium]|nr:hypothetical protein [Sphingobacteriales bacterium]
MTKNVFMKNKRKFACDVSFVGELIFNIFTMRRGAGLTQERVATELRICKPTFTNRILSEGNVSIYEILRLSELFNYDLLTDIYQHYSGGNRAPSASNMVSEDNAIYNVNNADYITRKYLSQIKDLTKDVEHLTRELEQAQENLKHKQQAIDAMTVAFNTINLNNKK